MGRFRIMILLLFYVATASAGDKIMWQRFVNSTLPTGPSTGWKTLGYCLDEKGNTYLAAIRSSGDSTAPVIYKYSKEGALLWKNLIIPIEQNSKYRFDLNGKLLIDMDGNLVYISVGYDTTNYSISGKYKMYTILYKTTPSGTVLSTKFHNVNNIACCTGRFCSSTVNQNGDIFVGFDNDKNQSGSELFILGYNKNFDSIRDYSNTSLMLQTYEYIRDIAVFSQDSLLFISYSSGDGVLNYWKILCLNYYTNDTLWQTNFSRNDIYNYPIQLETMNGYLYLSSYRLFKISISDGTILKESTENYYPIAPFFEINSNRIFTINKDNYLATTSSNKRIVVYDADSLKIINQKVLDDNQNYSILSRFWIKDSFAYALILNSLDDVSPKIQYLKLYKMDTILNILDSFTFSYPVDTTQLIYQYPGIVIDTSHNVFVISDITFKNDNFNIGSVLIQKICFDCAENFSGRVYMDMNQNCVFDSSDYVIAGNLVKLLPDNDYTLTDNQGYYYFFNTSSSVNIECIPFITGIPFCNGISSIGANMSNITVDSIDFGYILGKFQHNDIEAKIVAGIARPGFNQFCCAIFSNHSAEPLFNTKVSVTIDNHFSFVSSSKPYDSVSGKTYYFTIDTLQINAAVQINLIVNADVNLVSLGDPFLHSTEAFLANDTDLLNNLDTANGIIVGSYDPNYIAVSPIGITKDHLIENGTTLNYYIEFQNTGTDTAFNVKIDIPLDADLDLNTFHFNGSTHTCRPQLEGKSLSFSFDNIQLVDSNKGYEASIGFLNYSFTTKNCKDGTRIDAQASIYFDYNKPIITNSVFNTVGRPGSLFDPDNMDDFNLFPNPGKTNEFKLVVNLVSSSYNICISDITGRQVPFSNKSYLHNGKYYHTISIKDNAEGLYFIQMQTPKKVITRKWVYSKG